MREEFHHHPGTILDGEAMLNFADVEGDRPLIVRTHEDRRPSGRVIRRLEVGQTHPEGRDWTTLEFPIDAQPNLSFDLAFKARLMPATKAYVMGYSDAGSHEIGICKIDQHEAVYRLQGRLPLSFLVRPWRLGITLPGNTWFAFQIWDIDLRWRAGGAS